MSKMQLISAVWLCLLLRCVKSAAVEGGPYPLEEGASPQEQYGVVIDAGSTGTRARVYKWDEQTDKNKVPSISEVYSHGESPGVSSFAQNLDGLNDYIGRLLTEASENVPTEAHSRTRLYCMATAGMRFLVEDHANDIMDHINTIFMDPDKNPFHYDPLNTRILSGEEEGVFAWIAANYLNGYFHRVQDDPDELSTGIMEMGGASLQIAFRPDGSILADKFPVKVGGRIYPLYVHSFLTYGQNLAHEWVRNYLYDESAQPKDNITNPCFFKEDTLTETIQGEEVTFIGSGDPERCAQLLDIFVYDVDEERCHPKPCSIGTVYQPTINPQMQFFALRVFRYSMQSIKVLGDDGQLNMTNIKDAASAHCSKSIFRLRNETGRNDVYQSLECLASLYIPTLITKAFKFPEDTTNIRVVGEINGKDPEWTLGAMIYENERREWKCPQDTTSGATTMTSSLFTAVLAGIVICRM